MHSTSDDATACTAPGTTRRCMHWTSDYMPLHALRQELHVAACTGPVTTYHCMHCTSDYTPLHCTRLDQQELILSGQCARSRRNAARAWCCLLCTLYSMCGADNVTAVARAWCCLPCTVCVVPIMSVLLLVRGAACHVHCTVCVAPIMSVLLLVRGAACPVCVALIISVLLLVRGAACPVCVAPIISVLVRGAACHVCVAPIISVLYAVAHWVAQAKFKLITDAATYADKVDLLRVASSKFYSQILILRSWIPAEFIKRTLRRFGDVGTTLFRFKFFGSPNRYCLSYLQTICQ